MTIKQMVEKDMFKEINSYTFGYKMELGFLLIDDISNEKQIAYFHRGYGYQPFNTLFNFSEYFNTLKQAEDYLKKEFKRIKKELKTNIIQLELGIEEIEIKQDERKRK